MVILRWAFIFLISTGYSQGKALTLENYLESRLVEDKTHFSQQKTDAPSIINPFRDFEYTYERKYLDRPMHDQGTDIFTLNLKPFNELKLIPRARKVTRDLIEKSNTFRISQNLCHQVKVAIHQILSESKSDLARTQKPFLKRFMNQQKSLASADAKTLREILELQMKMELVERESEKTSGTRLKSTERSSLVQQMVEKSKKILASLEKEDSNSQSLEVEKAELELDRIEDSINSDSGFNGITQLQIRQNRSNNLDTEYRVGLSIPLDWNSDEEYRKKALRMYRETQIQAGLDAAKLDYLKTFEDLGILSREISILHQQLKNLKKLTKTKSGRIAFTAQLLAIDTEFELYEKIEDFYTGYLTLVQQHKVALSVADLFGAQ